MAESVMSQFVKFLKETNAIALAIAVVLGGAVQKLVSAIVADLIMPIVGMILPSGEWRSWKLPLRGDAALGIGDVLGAAIDFVIIAWVIYFIATKLLGVKPAAK